MLCYLYTRFEPSQLSCLGSLVGKSVAWRADGQIPPEAANFSLKNDCFGRVVLRCFAFLLFVVVVALPFSASVSLIVYVPNVLNQMVCLALCSFAT